MSLFVLFNSLFILHLSLYLLNYQFYFPNTLLFSTVFPLLNGPLIYFYFKITAIDYKLKWIDAVHLVPAFALLIYLSPFYALSSIEKFVILFNEFYLHANQINCAQVEHFSLFDCHYCKLALEKVLVVAPII